MNRLYFGAMLATTAFCAMASLPTQASTITLTGAHFNVTYDPSTLNLFGSLNLVGDNLFFTPSNFKATSTNGAGVVTTDSTASGIILSAHPGYQFGALTLAELGDYQLQGSSSTVSVSGQLRAFDYNNSFATQTTSAITATGPLTTADGASHDWVATSQITNSTHPLPNPLFPPVYPWLSNATQVDVTIENLLTAYTATGTGPQLALIEKKFNGVELSVTPLPGTLWLMLSGLAGAFGVARRRQG